MSQYNVLLVEDDPSLGFRTKYFLEQHDYRVTHCLSVITAWKFFMKGNFDICLCEVILQQQNGLELIKQIRKKNSTVPIFILSSKFNDTDRIAGLECGADCFVPKPYNLEELRLRMQIFLRNNKQISSLEPCRFMIGSYMFDFNEMNLTIPEINYEIALTQRECALLLYLCNHVGILIKKEDILIDVWGKSDHFIGRSLDVFIGRIRKFFRNQPDIELKTIHGIGYKFNYTAKRTVS